MNKPILIKIVKDILEARTKNLSEDQWGKSIGELYNSLALERDHKIIREAIALDEGDQLPFEPKKLMFEKLNFLSKNKKNLQDFAWWLQLNGGPDWDVEVEGILEESKNYK